MSLWISPRYILLALEKCKILWFSKFMFTLFFFSCLYTLYREIFVLFSLLLPSLWAGEFKTWLILMSYIISIKTKLCLGEFKTGWNRLQARQSKITQDEYFPVYSCTCFEIHVFHVSGYFNYTYGQPGDSPVTKCFQIDYEPDISKEQIQVGCWCSLM